MLSRRIVAFEANICRLLARKCCMWTFTLMNAMEPREASKAWNALLTKLRRGNPAWSGVRVYEMHGGKWDEFSHGLHVHLVSCDFYSDKAVNSIVKSTGLWNRWERTELFDNPSAAYYIGKYLSKKRPPALKGMRLQGCFGIVDYTRLRQVVINCDRARCFKVAARLEYNDGREWDRRGWMEKLHLIAKLHFHVVANNLQWDEDRQGYVDPAKPDPFAHRRTRQFELLTVPHSTRPVFDPASDRFALN